ncbi:unnamed protein product [Musa textilis]
MRRCLGDVAREGMRCCLGDITRKERQRRLAYIYNYIYNIYLYIYNIYNYIYTERYTEIYRSVYSKYHTVLSKYRNFGMIQNFNPWYISNCTNILTHGIVGLIDKPVWTIAHIVLCQIGMYRPYLAVHRSMTNLVSSKVSLWL